MDNIFSFIITYNDESGLWANIWKHLKLQLNLHFASIKFKENMAVMKSLSNLNIKMLPSSLEIPHIQMLVIKINEFSDLKKGVKEKVLLFNDKNKSPFIIFLMDIENSDSSVKNSLKLMEKLKIELKNNELKLLPTTLSHVKVIDIVSEFFKDLKTKISFEINSKMVYFYNQIETVKTRKHENKDFTYNYIVNKENLLNYLQITDFWEEIIKMNEEDLFVNFPLLSSQNLFLEPFSLVDFNENLIKKKIFERNLSNIDYQQYIVFHILRSCKYLRDFKRLNKALIKIFSDFSSLSNYFTSKYHFNFWTYIYCITLIPFLRSLKTNFYTTLDEEVNITNQVYVYHQAKKFLKTFSKLIKQDIPGIHQFESSIHYLNNEQPIINRKESLENLLPNDEEFIIFINDLKNGPFTERNKTFLDNRTTLFEDYLKILNIIEDLNNLKHNPKLAVKMQLEKIPILLKLNKLISIRTILNDCLKILKKDKWDIIYNFYTIIFIILLGFLEKNEENINLIFDYLDLQSQLTQPIGIGINMYSEKFIYEFVSNYINSSDFKQNKINLRNIKIDLTKLLDLTLIDEHSSHEKLETTLSNSCNNYNKSIYLNLLDSKSIILCFKNKSRLNLMVDCIKLFFEDEISNEKIMFEAPIDKFIIGNGETNISFLFEAKRYEKDMILKLNNILIRLSCGVEGLFRMNDYNYVINVKTSNLKFNYVFVNNDIDCKFFTNTLYIGYFIFSNVNQYETLMIKFNQDRENYIRVLNKFELHSLDDLSNASEKLRFLEEHSKESVSLQNKGIIVSLEDDRIIIKNIDLEKFILKIQVIFLDSGNISDNICQFPIALYSKSNNKENILFKELLKFKLSNLFDIKNRFRNKGQSFMVQTSIKLNSEYEHPPVVLKNEEIFHFDKSNIVNFVKCFKNSSIDEIIQAPYFNYRLNHCSYSYYISQTDFHQYISNIKELNYFIKINTSNNKTFQDGVQIFKEIKIILEIEKYTDFESIIMIRIKENLNWIIIGKSKFLERFTEKCKKVIHFNIIPFTDGYVRVPEIHIQEYIVNKKGKTNSDLPLDSSSDFYPLMNSLIENDQKIIKVYPINNVQMKLNII